MKFFHNLLNRVFNLNHSKASNDAVCRPTYCRPTYPSYPSYQSEEKEQTKDPFENERNRLAELCKMGDIAAMYAMAELMLSSCPDQVQSAVHQYEADPCEDTLPALEECIMAYGDDSRKLQYYMMWIVRAAVYGHEKAKALLDKCTYYKEHAYIPYEHYVTKSSDMSFWSSNDLYEAGLCDMIQNEEDCWLYFDQSVEYIRLVYVSYYSSADDDGFGAEMEYESVVFDEFFKRIPVLYDPLKKETVFGLEQVKAEREAFWEAQQKRHERQYKATMQNL